MRPAVRLQRADGQRADGGRSRGGDRSALRCRSDPRGRSSGPRALRVLATVATAAAAAADARASGVSDNGPPEKSTKVPRTPVLLSHALDPVAAAPTTL
eukprot:scaffold81363_cov68-Phaeocystis_antarctica.AAC.5